MHLSYLVQMSLQLETMLHIIPVDRVICSETIRDQGYFCYAAGSHLNVIAGKTGKFMHSKRVKRPEPLLSPLDYPRQTQPSNHHHNA